MWAKIRRSIIHTTTARITEIDMTGNAPARKTLYALLILFKTRTAQLAIRLDLCQATLKREFGTCKAGTFAKFSKLQQNCIGSDVSKAIVNGNVKTKFTRSANFLANPFAQG